ncbi:MAG: hypothetical protein V3R90_05665 [Limibaculum sp.]
MKSAALARLQRLLGAASAAEAARLAGVLAQSARCRARAARLRGEIGVSVGEPGPGAGPLVAPDLSGAELAAASRWDLWLAERARAEEARAGALEVEAAAIRPRLARAFGRESAAAAMAEKARIEERRLAERRAEAATIAPRRVPDQSISSGSEPAGTLAGSPGIA